MKVYCIINSNPEGYNLIGIYDTEEEANTQCELINKQNRKEREELYADAEMDEETKRLYIEMNWDDCHIIPFELNTRRPHTRKDYHDRAGD